MKGKLNKCGMAAGVQARSPAAAATAVPSGAARIRSKMAHSRAGRCGRRGPGGSSGWGPAAIAGSFADADLASIIARDGTWLASAGCCRRLSLAGLASKGGLAWAQSAAAAN